MNKFKHTYGVRTVANDVAFVYTGAQSPNFIWKVRAELVSQTPVSWFMIPDDPIRRRPPPATKKNAYIFACHLPYCLCPHTRPVSYLKPKFY